MKVYIEGRKDNVLRNAEVPLPVIMVAYSPDEKHLILRWSEPELEKVCTEVNCLLARLRLERSQALQEAAKEEENDSILVKRDAPPLL
jgi:hypothetical protein